MVYEVLRAGRRRVDRLLLAEGAQRRGRLASVLEQASVAGIPIEELPRAALERLVPGNPGVLAEVEPYPYASLSDILERVRLAGESAMILLLDLLQDPQNFGTLLRTAEAVGVHGVVLPKHGCVGITSAVVGASAGASEHLLVARDNLARAIDTLREQGLWAVGLENSPQALPLDQADLARPLALVVGSEGEGMRRLVRERCDFLVRLPMRGRVESLNAAVAGSVALYAAWAARQYRGAGAAGQADAGERFIDGGSDC